MKHHLKIDGGTFEGKNFGGVSQLILINNFIFQMLSFGRAL